MNSLHAHMFISFLTIHYRHICIYIHTYIHTEREKEKERERELVMLVSYPVLSITIYT